MATRPSLAAASSIICESAPSIVCSIPRWTSGSTSAGRLKNCTYMARQAAGSRRAQLVGAENPRERKRT
eukprot:scaffold53630_cov67-Phaeocystis_antarctica.AAC.2